jgi:hypothetical protein
MALQDEQLGRLGELLPLPQLHLPYIFDTDLGRSHVDHLARAALAGIADVVATDP